MSEIANQFSGLPISDLIGGPLMAAAKAQISLAQTTSEFIHTVGFEEKKGKLELRTADFKYSQFIDGKKEDMQLSVPLLTMVKVPSLAIKTVDIQFDMEVKSTTVDKSASNKELDTKAAASGFFGWGKASASIQGSVSSSQENTRSTDNSAKYHIELHAADDGMPEGLSRVLDMLNNAIAPQKTTIETVDDKKLEGEKEEKH